MRINRQILLIGLVILFIAAVPRCIELLNKNYLFGHDQGIFYEAVKNIVVNKKLTLIGAEVGGQGGFFQGPGWYYTLAIPFFLWKGDPYAGMILMFGIGLAVVFLAFLIGNQIFDKKTAIVVAVLIAISPEIISQSRFIWPPFPMSLLTIIYLFFLYKVLERKKKYFIPMVFTVGLMSHFEIATAGVLVIQLLILTPLLFYKRLVTLKVAIFSIVGFFVTQLSLILFDFKHEHIILKGITNLFFADNPNHKVTLKYIEAMFFNHLDVFKFNFLSTFQMSNILWPVVILICIVGSLMYIRDRKNNFSKRWFVGYLTLSPILFFLIHMLNLWPMWSWWILELSIFYCFLFGILSVYLWKKIAVKFILCIVFVIFLWGFANQVIKLYTDDLYDYGGTHKIKGKLDSIDYIYQDAKGEQFGLFVFTPPINTYPYDYLLWWHGERKYGFKPSTEKKGLFYLLIEPDPHQPWTYKGWIETVIKSGKLVQERKLPSGFIIQKRINEDTEN